MKHLIETKTTMLLALILLTVTGCSEANSRTQSIASVASETIALDTVDIEATPPAAQEQIAEGTDVNDTEALVVASSVDAAPAESESTNESAESVENPEATISSSLELTRITMARGVASYEPVEAGDRFTADGRLLYAYMQIINRESADQEVVIRYEREDGLLVGPVQLTVPPGTRGYRTFTRTGWVRQPGIWTVSVSSTDGNLLGETEFTIDS